MHPAQYQHPTKAILAAKRVAFGATEADSRDVICAGVEGEHILFFALRLSALDSTTAVLGSWDGDTSPTPIDITTYVAPEGGAMWGNADNQMWIGKTKPGESLVIDVGSGGACEWHVTFVQVK